MLEDDAAFVGLCTAADFLAFHGKIGAVFGVARAVVCLNAQHAQGLADGGVYAAVHVCYVFGAHVFGFGYNAIG